MLAAIVAKCHGDTDLLCAVQPWNGSFSKRAYLGLFQKADYQRFMIKWHLLAGAIPRRLRHQYGIVLESETSAILDASGFQFGDQWGPIICRKAAVRFQNAKRMGKKIILLPQAFGPFESTSTRQSMKAILRCSDLVYARDETSLQYLSDLDTNQSAIRLAPDFTNLLPAQTTYINSDKAAGACLLPNQRMLDKAPAETSSRYIGFLAATARTLNDRGLSPFFLIHEIATDRAVVERVNQQLDVPLPIVEESDVFQIKHILGNSRTVIGSRYHGLVSALSQGVPCVATGWSHKYFHLMKDYDCQDYFVDLSGSQPERQLSGLLDPGYLQNCRRRVANRAQELRLQAEAMWREVFEVLGVA